MFEVGGHLVRLSANICQLHRPNTIPIFCAAVCRDYRLRTFIGFNPKFLFHVCNQLLAFFIGINDDGLAFADIAFQDDPCCQGLYVLLEISSQRTCAVGRVVAVVGDKGFWRYL